MLEMQNRVTVVEMRIILNLFLIALGTSSTADTLFVGERKQNPTFKECSNVIHNGTLIREKDNTKTYLYRNQIVHIAVGPDRFKCFLFDNVKKN